MKLNEEMSLLNSLLENMEPQTSPTGQMTMMVSPETTTFVSNPHEYNDADDDEQTFSDLELRLAKRFIELIGNAEKARDLINKCDECEECLGIIDDNDEDTISDVASMMPYDKDLPTSRNIDLSSLYNPNATAGPDM